MPERDAISRDSADFMDEGLAVLVGHHRQAAGQRAVAVRRRQHAVRPHGVRQRGVEPPDRDVGDPRQRLDRRQHTPLRPTAAVVEDHRRADRPRVVRGHHHVFRRDQRRRPRVVPRDAGEIHPPREIPAPRRRPVGGVSGKDVIARGSLQQHRKTLVRIPPDRRDRQGRRWGGRHRRHVGRAAGEQGERGQQGRQGEVLHGVRQFRIRSIPKTGCPAQGLRSPSLHQNHAFSYKTPAPKARSIPAYAAGLGLEP